MGRKDVMHRTEGAVADFPAVKVRGIDVNERVSDLEADELLYTDDRRLTGKLAGGR